VCVCVCVYVCFQCVIKLNLHIIIVSNPSKSVSKSIFQWLLLLLRIFKISLFPYYLRNDFFHFEKFQQEIRTNVIKKVALSAYK
jgi:hypothetical protein